MIKPFAPDPYEEYSLDGYSARMYKTQINFSRRLIFIALPTVL